MEPPTPSDDDDVVEYQFPLQRLSLITEQAVAVGGSGTLCCCCFFDNNFSLVGFGSRGPSRPLIIHAGHRRFFTVSLQTKHGLLRRGQTLDYRVHCASSTKTDTCAASPLSALYGKLIRFERFAWIVLVDVTTFPLRRTTLHAHSGNSLTHSLNASPLATVATTS